MDYQPRRPTALTVAAWDYCRESIRGSVRVTDFQLAKLDGTAFAFRYTDESGAVKNYVLYRDWPSEKLPYPSATHLLLNSFPTLNQMLDERNNVQTLSVKIFEQYVKAKELRDVILPLH